jgi:queuine tRNA-ribosyltransferase
MPAVNPSGSWEKGEQRAAALDRTPSARPALPFAFELQATSGRARAGLFHTPHGPIATPAFAPVGTQATVKAVSPDQLRELGASLILANAYHLYLRPGDERIARLGGMHRFMGWEGTILTDSGGFQLFSLADQRTVDDDGVSFRSHLDGSLHRFTPEKAVAVQENLGADIIMALDECAEPLDRAYNEQALARTHAWAERCVRAKTRGDQALFAIVQGGIFTDLRLRSAEFLAGLGTPGMAIGGLSVGESKQQMHAVLEALDPALPQDRPRYLMGVGSPEDLVEAVRRGVDLFDSVLPTRMARNDAALTRSGRLNLRNSPYAEDESPIDPECTCATCRHFSRAYLRHLIVAREMLSATLLSIHNLHTLISLSADLRQAILEDRLLEFVQGFHERRAQDAAEA